MGKEVLTSQRKPTSLTGLDDYVKRRIYLFRKPLGELTKEEQQERWSLGLETIIGCRS